MNTYFELDKDEHETCDQCGYESTAEDNVLVTDDEHIFCNTTCENKYRKHHKDRVVFKMLEGEVIAFLPDNPANIGHIDSYMHIGQHGMASWRVYYKCKPAKPEDYAELLDELVRIGYDVKVCKRIARAR